MKELDALLVAYLERRYGEAPDAEKTAFQAFLEGEAGLLLSKSQLG